MFLAVARSSASYDDHTVLTRTPQTLSISCTSCSLGPMCLFRKESVLGSALLPERKPADWDLPAGFTGKASAHEHNRRPEKPRSRALSIVLEANAAVDSKLL